MKNFLKIVPLFILFTFPVITLAGEMKGSGWIAQEGDGHKRIILFEEDGSFTYLNVSSPSGNEGKVYNDPRDTWKEVDNNLVLSFTDGYMICSLKRVNWFEEIINGSCINVQGKTDTIKLKLIK